MRFSSYYKHRFPLRAVLGIAILLVVLFAVIYGSGRLAASDTAHKRELLESAVLRLSVECYALEGSYPPNLEYLKEHYGLTYDEETFYVDYHPVGSNLAPDITILEL